MQNLGEKGGFSADEAKQWRDMSIGIDEAAWKKGQYGSIQKYKDELAARRELEKFAKRHGVKPYCLFQGEEVLRMVTDAKTLLRNCKLPIPDVQSWWPSH